MTHIITQCDRCKGRAKENHTVVNIATGPGHSVFGKIDLCQGCAVELARWLVAPVGIPAELAAILTGRSAPAPAATASDGPADPGNQ
jgi:hypothetical protein